MRRQFLLPSNDVAFLETLGLPWEAVLESGSNWLIVRGRPLPPGYTVTAVDTALLIPPSYPDTQIDMAYFHPGLTTVDGRQIGATSTQTVDGRPWQRWSRHRTKANPWRAGIDDIAGHLVLVDHWLLKALGRAA